MEEPESGGKIFVCNFSFRGELKRHLPKVGQRYIEWDSPRACIFLS